MNNHRCNFAVQRFVSECKQKLRRILPKVTSKDPMHPWSRSWQKNATQRESFEEANLFESPREGQSECVNLRPLPASKDTYEPVYSTLVTLCFWWPLGNSRSLKQWNHSWKQLKPAMTSWKNYNTWRQTNKKWNKSFRGRRTQIKRRSSCSHAPMLFGVYPLSLVHARWSVILLCLVQFPSLSSVLTALSFDFHGFHSCSGSSMFPVYLVFRWLVRVSFIWGSLFFHLVLS